MALNKTQLKSDIKTMLNELKEDLNQEAAIERYASQLAEAVDNYVKTAQIVGTDSSGGQIQGSLI